MKADGDKTGVRWTAGRHLLQERQRRRDSGLAIATHADESLLLRHNRRGCCKMNCKVQDAAASVICQRLQALAYHIRTITYSKCRFGICDHISFMRDAVQQLRPVWDC